MHQHSILICEPDKLVVELLSFHLGNRGYHVRVARDGREAIAEITRLMPDAVILAAPLSFVSSDEVLHCIREGDGSTGLTDVPVMMLSERKKDEEIVRALTLGANDYILKPFSPAELMVRLAKLLRQHQVHSWAKSLQRTAREPVSIPATLLLPDDREIDCVVKDLSEDGFMAFSETPVDRYTWLGLSLPKHGIIRAQVRWCQHGRMGGLFERPLVLRDEGTRQAA